jgi:hypothetical protein
MTLGSVRPVGHHGKIVSCLDPRLREHATVKAAYRYWQQQVSAGPDATARKQARQMVKKLTPYL